MIHRKANSSKKRIIMIQGLLTILDGLIKLLSFEYFYGDFSYKYMIHKLMK